MYGVTAPPPPPGPIFTQPGVVPPSAQWMQPTMPQPGVPPGLEYLTVLDQVLAKQVGWIVELLEAFTGWECANKYVITNSFGQQCFYAFEESTTCARQCCKNHRHFVLHIVNNMNQEVIRVERPFKCCSHCCWCAGMCNHCADEVVVEAPPGNVIGYVQQRGSFCAIDLDIKDAEGNIQLVVDGPLCEFKCCKDVEFPVLSADKSREVGNIKKQWTGFAKEAFTDADNFSVSFPMDLDVRMKATMLGALFLIDFMAFEDNEGDRHRD